MPARILTSRRRAPLVGAAALVMAAAVASPAAAQDADAASLLDDAGRAAVEQIVRDYLVANPEVVIDALNAYQARQEEQIREQQQLRIGMLQAQIFDAATSPVGGNLDGDVTLVEFFDYNCGHCRRVAPSIEAMLAADDSLRVVYKELPILSEGSVLAARAALASQWQDLYEPFHLALMGHDEGLDEDAVFGIAEGVGLDLDQLRTDMDRDEVVGEIAANMELARQLQINGTPAFIVGDQVIPGAVPQSALEALVSDARGG